MAASFNPKLPLASAYYTATDTPGTEIGNTTNRPLPDEHTGAQLIAQSSSVHRSLSIKHQASSIKIAVPPSETKYD